MGFSEEVIERAWRRAGGRCECRRKTHRHSYVRCNKQLVANFVQVAINTYGFEKREG